MNLRALREDAAQALGEAMDGFRRGADARVLHAQSEEVALHFVTIAAACLLVDGNSQKFLMNLVRCAENGRQFLRLMRSRELDLPSASKNISLLAALTAADFERAAQIASLSRTTRNEAQHEYEDEFLWASILNGLAATPLASSRDDVESALEGVVEIAPAVYESRAEAVRALLARDGEAFEDAMTRAAREYGIWAEDQVGSPSTSLREFAPHRFIWLEGLALLRLAERAGMGLVFHLDYCPRLARVPMTEVYEGDWSIDPGLPD